MASIPGEREAAKFYVVSYTYKTHDSEAIFKMSCSNVLKTFIVTYVIHMYPLTAHAKFEVIKPSSGLSTRSPFYGSIVLK